MICYHAVCLLGHPAIVAAKACFHMTNGNMQLDSRESRSQRGVRITIHDEDVGLLILEDTFQAHQDRARLVGVRARANSQIVLRSRNAQVFKERPRHGTVIVLTRVDKDRIETIRVPGH